MDLEREIILRNEGRLLLDDLYWLKREFGSDMTDVVPIHLKRSAIIINAAIKAGKEAYTPSMTRLLIHKAHLEALVATMPDLIRLPVHMDAESKIMERWSERAIKIEITFQ